MIVIIHLFNVKKQANIKLCIQSGPKHPRFFLHLGKKTLDERLSCLPENIKWILI